MATTTEPTVGAASAEVRLPPSTVGSVILDVGGDIGAVIVSAVEEQCGLEIELVPMAAGVVTHTEVRERRLPEGAVYAAVFPGVPSGAYHLRDPDGLESPVLVRGGEITAAPWPV
jgi:hypothetical protein